MLPLFISIILYLSPIFILFYMAFEIRFRNKDNDLNLVASRFFISVMLFFLGEFLVRVFPIEYAEELSLYLKYVPAFLLMSVALHFLVRLTPRFNHLSAIQVFLMCVVPISSSLLLFYPPEWIYLDFIEQGDWKTEVPSPGLYWYTISVGVYTNILGLFFVGAGRKYIKKHAILAKQEKQINVILSGVVATVCVAYIGSYYKQLPFLPEEISYPDLGVFSLLIFTIFIRYAMVKYAFLPSIERKYQILFEFSPMAIILLDQEGKIRDANPAALNLVRLPSQKILQLPFILLLDQKDRVRFKQQFGNAPQQWHDIQDEYIIITSAGENKLVNVQSELIISEGENYHYFIITDITESRAAQEKITYLAYHDELTGLVKRNKFHQEMQAAFHEMADSQNKVAVMLMDLDQFKIINDTKGHHVGDRLLKHVADQLRCYASSAKAISRLGGDEFGLLYTNIKNIEQVREIASGLFESFKSPFIYENEHYYVSCSMGISLTPEHGRDPDSLLRYADIAMYYAKNLGKNSFQFFKPSLEEAGYTHMTTDAHLRKALEQNEFILYYQPVIDVTNGNIVGMEALIRWVTPNEIVISPNDFIPLAEQTGLIIPIEYWVLETACEMIKKITDMGFHEKVISVNISAAQFHQHNFLDKLKEILHKTQIDPHLLCLEITERTAFEDQENSLEICKKIMDLNVKLAIDDFGTGYSSLALLKMLTFDSVKIDRSFIRDMLSNNEDRTIVKAIIAMAHSLKQRVVAEGVEHQGQLELLKTLECDYVQGYYFSKPLAEKEYIQFMLTKTAKAE